jgi:hypothetical protein
MSWVLAISNQTGETITFAGSSIEWGSWTAPPPDSIAPGAVVTLSLEPTLGRLQGSVAYCGRRGEVTFAWAITGASDSSAPPQSVYGAQCEGVYTASDGNSSPADSATPPDASFTISANSPPLPVAPGPAAPAGTPPPAPKTTVVPQGDHKKYTDNPNERTTVRTTPSIPDVVTQLRASWPELTEVGARTLASQWAAETAFGKYMYNYNAGNVKATADQPHMYLHGVWEVTTPDGAASAVAAAGNLAHIATEEEKKAHGWRCKDSQAIVVFNPPHSAARFRAYDSLADGLDRYMKMHQKFATKNADYLPAILAGDTDAVAHILHTLHYYTANEADYQAGMRRCKKQIDAKLGPVTPATAPNDGAPLSNQTLP